MLCFYNFYVNMIVNNIITSVPTVVTLSDNANITEVVDIIKAFVSKGKVDVLIYFSTNVRIKICKKRNWLRNKFRNANLKVITY